MTAMETAAYLSKLGYNARYADGKIYVTLKKTDPWYRRNQATRAIYSVCYHGKVRWIRER